MVSWLRDLKVRFFFCIFFFFFFFFFFFIFFFFFFVFFFFFFFFFFYLFFFFPSSLPILTILKYTYPSSFPSFKTVSWLRDLKVRFFSCILFFLVCFIIY